MLRFLEASDGDVLQAKSRAYEFLQTIPRTASADLLIAANGAFMMLVRRIYGDSVGGIPPARPRRAPAAGRPVLRVVSND